MRFKKILIVVASLCLLSACATSGIEDKAHAGNAGPEVKSSPIGHAHTIELLDFISTYPELTAEAQKALFIQTSQKLTTHQNDLDLRLKRGAMLALPNSVMRDTIAAQPILQTLLDKNELNESHTNLVKLLLSFTSDHNKQEMKLRDDAKRIDVLKLNNKALVQKLNDLRNIEKNMIERNTKMNSNP